MVLVAQIIIAWHDSDNNKEVITKVQNKGIIIARIIAGRGQYNLFILLKTNKN